MVELDVHARPRPRCDSASNERSDSSASTTSHSPAPQAALRARRAQLAADEVAGLQPGASSAWAAIERRRRLAVRARRSRSSRFSALSSRAARRGQLAQAARARGDALGVVGRDRGGDELDVVAGGDVGRRRGRRGRSIAQRAQRLEAGGLRAVRARDRRAERVRDARQPLIPAPPIPTRCMRRPLQGSVMPPSPRRGEHLARRSSRRRVRAASRRRRAAPSRASRAGSASSGADLSPQPLRPSARRRARRPRRPPRPSSARWRSGGRRPRAGTAPGSPAPVRGDLEDRAAGAGDGEVGRGQRVAERLDVGPQVVARGAGTARARSAVVVALRRRRAARRNGASRERLDRGLVDRARAQRAAEDEHARLVRARGRSGLAPRPRSVDGGGTGRPVTR